MQLILPQSKIQNELLAPIKAEWICMKEVFFIYFGYVYLASMDLHYSVKNAAIITNDQSTSGSSWKTMNLMQKGLDEVITG